MKYARPEILLTSNSMGAIQGGSCKRGMFLEYNGSAYDETATAYEADE